MPRYKIIISYDGTSFAGWQVQANGKAIQPLIQKALETILRHPIALTGSGRTDAGVHAIGQVAHFDTEKKLDPHKILFSINALLPNEIRVLSMESVPDDFHARYSAVSKIYHYHLCFGPTTSPFTRLYCSHITSHCDLDQMQKGASVLLGSHDFTSFANQPHLGIASRDPIRNLMRLDFIPEKDGVRLEFEADGFLYKMVRNITGTLLDVGSGKIRTEEIRGILESKDRKKAGQCAPAQGLFLMQVNYTL